MAGGEAPRHATLNSALSTLILGQGLLVAPPSRALAASLVALQPTTSVMSWTPPPFPPTPLLRLLEMETLTSLLPEP